MASYSTLLTSLSSNLIPNKVYDHWGKTPAFLVYSTNGQYVLKFGSDNSLSTANSNYTADNCSAALWSVFPPRRSSDAYNLTFSNGSLNITDPSWYNNIMLTVFSNSNAVGCLLDNDGGLKAYDGCGNVLWSSNGNKSFSPSLWISGNKNTYKNFSYKGCFIDGPNRAVPVFLGDGYTMNSCIDTAIQKGYNTAALQSGNQCFVGTNSNYSQYGQNNDNCVYCGANANTGLWNPGGFTNIVFQAPTIGSVGLNYNQGNGQVATTINTEGILTADNNFATSTNKNINLPFTGKLTCTNGFKTNSECNNLFKNLGIKSFTEQEFLSDSEVSGEQNVAVLGKQNGYQYTCASYDGKNCIKNYNPNNPPLQELNNIKCESAQTFVETPHNLCNNAFNYWNLYPSKNPLLIRGKNLNQNLKNTISDPNTLFNIANNLGLNSNTSSSISQELTNIMTEAPLKLGCCLATNNTNAENVHVHVPISPYIASENPLLNSFNYEKNLLSIPKNTCPTGYNNGSKQCDAFMNTYCKNVANVFQEQNLPAQQFSEYSPECACYAPLTDDQKFLPVTTLPVCYKPGCAVHSNAYIDPLSRGQTCSQTICNAIVNASNNTAGGGVAVSPTIQNNCGQYIPEQKPIITPSNNTPANNNNTSNTTPSNNNNTSNIPSSNIPSSNSQANLSNSTIYSESNTFNLYLIITIVIIILICSSCSASFMLLKK